MLYQDIKQTPWFVSLYLVCVKSLNEHTHAEIKRENEQQLQLEGCPVTAYWYSASTLLLNKLQVIWSDLWLLVCHPQGDYVSSVHMMAVRNTVVSGPPFLKSHLTVVLSSFVLCLKFTLPWNSILPSLLEITAPSQLELPEVLNLSHLFFPDSLCYFSSSAHVVFAVS